MADTREKKKLQERSRRKDLNRGPWRAAEDQKLAEAIDIHGAKNWTAIAAKAGLNRCAKSCRLRWMNYLRPNIKRGNISDQEEDLIIRLHRLLGNRWSLIAARLPGRTDNEIKNYWNYHLSKKKLDEGVLVAGIATDAGMGSQRYQQGAESSTPNGSSGAEDSVMGFDVDELFDFSNQDASTLEWITEFLDASDD